MAFRLLSAPAGNVALMWDARCAQAPPASLPPDLHGLLAALDLLPFGVIVVDRDAVVQRTNAAGAGILRAGRTLALTCRRLHAVKPLDDATLRTALATTVGRAAQQPGLPHTHLWRPRTGASLSAVLSACAPADEPPIDLPITLLVHDLDTTPVPDPDLLQTLYGLSPAEARVAALIAAGHAPAAIARTLHISINTVRTHLRQTRCKTASRSLADLTRRILSSGAWLRLPGG